MPSVSHIVWRSRGPVLFLYIFCPKTGSTFTDYKKHREPVRDRKYKAHARNAVNRLASKFLFFVSSWMLPACCYAYPRPASRMPVRTKTKDKKETTAWRMHSLVCARKRREPDVEHSFINAGPKRIRTEKRYEWPSIWMSLRFHVWRVRGHQAMILGIKFL